MRLARKSLIIIISCIIMCTTLTLGTFLVLSLTGAFSANANSDLVISTPDLQKEYDGKDLVGETYTIQSGEIREGYKIVVNSTSSIKDVGETSNELTVGILDQDGNDVTDRYEIEYDYGTLKIVKKKLVIQTASTAVLYSKDTKHSASGLHINGEFFEGNEILLESGDTIKFEVPEFNLVGTHENKTEISILNADGEDNSASYDVELSFGSVQIKQFKLTFSTASVEKVYDGKVLTDKTIKITQGKEVGHRYLVKESTLPSIENVGEVQNKLELIVKDEDGNNITESYLFEATYGKLVITPRELYIPDNTISVSKTYDNSARCSKFIDSDDSEYPNINLVNGHKVELILTAVSSDVGVYSSAQDEIEEFTYVIRKANGTEVTGNYKIPDQLLTVLTIQQKEVTLEHYYFVKEYDGNKNATCPVNDNEVLDGQKLTLVGVAEHNAGEYYGLSFDVENVKIYDKNTGGDKTHNYKILGNATLDLIITPRAISIITQSAEKEYDGTPLTRKEFEVGWGLAQGQTAQIDITGSQTEVGESENTVDESTLKIVDADMQEVSLDNYLISYNLGKLKVTKKQLIIKTASDSKPYDGKPLTNDTVEFENLEPEYLAKTTITVTGSQTEVGKSDNTVDEESLVIRDEQGNEIDKDLYVIVYELGELSVYKATITVGTATAEKEYDGTPLTANSSADYTVMGLPEGVSVDGEVSVIGSQTEVGESNNNVDEQAFEELLISKGLNLDNYNIKYNYGKLTVKKRTILIKTESAEKFFDGTPLTEPTYQIESQDITPELQAIIESAVTVTGIQMDVGTSDNTVEIGEIEGLDTNYYEIATELGKLTIKPRKIIIDTGSAEKVYDGQPLTSQEYTISGDGLAENHKINLITIGSQTLPGESFNSIDMNKLYIEDSEGNVFNEGQYIIEKINYGVLKVVDKQDGPPGGDGPGGDGPGGNDGPPGGKFGPPDKGEPKKVFTVNSTLSNGFYLKNESFGDYVGEGFIAAPVYDVTGTNPHEYFASRLSSYNETKLNKGVITIKDAGYVYAPYYSLESSSNAEVVNKTLYNGSDSRIHQDASVNNNLYSVEFYGYNFETASNLTALTPIEDGDYYEFLTKNYLAVKADTKYYILNTAGEQNDKFLRIDERIEDWATRYEQGDLAQKQVVINEVAYFVSTCAEYNLDYSYTTSDNVIGFIQEKEGVCQQFSATGTLLYRLIGIPARYTVGYVANVKQVGVDVDVMSNQAHAWVEIYLEHYGWIPVEVTGGSNSNGGSGEGPGDGGSGEGPGAVENATKVILTIGEYWDFSEQRNISLTIESRKGKYDALQNAHAKIDFEIKLEGGVDDISAKRELAENGEMTVKFDNGDVLTIRLLACPSPTEMGAKEYSTDMEYSIEIVNESGQNVKDNYSIGRNIGLWNVVKG